MKEVIYLLICDCNAFFVGKTIRELRQWIGNHLYYSTNRKLTTIDCHIGLHHIFNTQVVKFLVLEVVPQDLGDNWDRGHLTT